MTLRIFVLLFMLCVTSFKVNALGPIDGEVSLNYWDAELTAANGRSDNTVETGFINADLWVLDKFGVLAEWIDKDVSIDFSSEGANVINARKNIQLRYRIASFSDNNFIALGGGLEQIDFKNGGSVNGPKLSAQWRFGLPFSNYAYVHAGFVPSYEDGDGIDNISSTEYEAAINLTPFPFFSVRGGYRVFKLDYDGTANVPGDGNDFEGLFIGAGFHW